MAVIDAAVLLLQAKNYSGSGDWLDESGNGHDATPVNSPTFNGDHFTYTGANYHQISDHDDLDFGATDSFTIIVVHEAAAEAPGETRVLLGKGAAQGASGSAYSLIQSGSGSGTFGIADGSAAPTVPFSTGSWDAKHVTGCRRDVSADDLETFKDGTPRGTPTTDSTTATLAGAHDLYIARYAPANALHWEGHVYAVALWREALTDAEIQAAGEELIGGGNLLLLGVG